MAQGKSVSLFHFSLKFEPRPCGVACKGQEVASVSAVLVLCCVLLLHGVMHV